MAKQKSYCAVHIICYRQVELPVAIEISGHDCNRFLADRNRCRGAKRSIAIAEEDHHHVGGGVRHSEIELPIAVKIGCNEGS